MPYFTLSRTPRYTLSLALPLLLLYEGMAAMLPVQATMGLRNAADVMLKSAAYLVAGRWGTLALGVVLVGGAVALVVRDVRRSRDTPKPGLLLAMFAESAVLAVVFGVVVGIITAHLLGAAGLLLLTAQDPATSPTPLTPIESLPLATRLMLSLGAGIYEEIVFRVLLVGALALGARRLLGFRPLSAGLLAATIGALVFSAVHYIGPYGDPLQIQSFAFRFIAGLAFSALYLTRGFGITAWTHALYDVFVLVI